MATLRQLTSFSATESPFGVAYLRYSVKWDDDNTADLGWNFARRGEAGFVVADENTVTLRVIANYRSAFNEETLRSEGLQRFTVNNSVSVSGGVQSTLTVTLNAGELLLAKGDGFRGIWTTGRLQSYINTRGVANPPTFSAVPVKVLINQESVGGGSTRSITIPLLQNRGVAVELVDYEMGGSTRERGYGEADVDRGYDEVRPYATGVDLDRVPWTVEFAVNGAGEYAVAVDGGFIAFNMTAEGADILAASEVERLKNRREEEERPIIPPVLPPWLNPNYDPEDLSDQLKSAATWVVIAVVGIVLLSSAARGFGASVGGAVSGS